MFKEVKTIVLLSGIFLGLLPLSAFASSSKAFVVLSSSTSGIIVSDGSSYYEIDYNWDCYSSDFSSGETIYIDTYYSPGYGDTILLSGLFDTKTCEVTSSDSIDLDTYYVNEIVSSDEILVEDKWGNEYIVEYGIGCLSMWRYENKYIYIDDGYFLDGFMDIIYLLDSDDECSVWDVTDISSLDTGGTSSYYVYTDVTPPSYTSSVANVFTDSNVSTYGDWSDSHDPDPYFVWSGVEDVSGISGYYVYFGVDSEADPYVDGVYQTGTSFYSGEIRDEGSYYLILRAVDYYGNISDPFYWEFSYSELEEDLVEDTKEFSDEEPSQTTLPEGGAFIESKKDTSLIARLKGRILLQTEEHGEAWYVNPNDSLRYYMANGDIAYEMMRSFSLGITNADLEKINAVNSSSEMLEATSICSSNALANRLKGYILLQVEEHGEAWYIHPDTCRRIYMKDGEEAYDIMRYLSLGIANSDLEKMPSGDIE